MTVTESGVFQYIPMKLKRPIEVTEDGQGGVTVETYTMLEANTLTELTVRLDLEGVEAALRNHALLNDAAELLLAARLCRRLRIGQEASDSLFAEANVKLRLFFDGVAKTAEGEGYIELTGDEVDYVPAFNELIQAFGDALWED